MSFAPFRPSGEATVNIDVAAASGRVALSGAGTRQMRVMNNGTATAWIKFGDSAVAADAAADIPVGPGVTEVYTTAETYVAAIAAASTGKIYFTPGNGV